MRKSSWIKGALLGGALALGGVVFWSPSAPAGETIKVYKDPT